MTTLKGGVIIHDRTCLHTPSALARGAVYYCNMEASSIVMGGHEFSSRIGYLNGRLEKLTDIVIMRIASCEN
jgi:hypothetical protein